MKLFNTWFSFDRLKARMLEADPAWQHLHVNKRLVIADLTKACCDRQHPPSRIDLCRDPHGLPTGAAVWRWFGCHNMRLNEDGTVDFAIVHSLTIREAFRAGTDIIYDLIGFFNKMDGIRKEQKCAF